jgi:hypothetical protein
MMDLVYRNIHIRGEVVSDFSSPSPEHSALAESVVKRVRDFAETVNEDTSRHFEVVSALATTDLYGDSRVVVTLREKKAKVGQEESDAV